MLNVMYLLDSVKKKVLIPIFLQLNVFKTLYFFHFFYDL